MVRWSVEGQDTGKWRPQQADDKQVLCYTSRQFFSTPKILSFCFCLMSSDAKSILGTIYKVSLFWIYHS